MRNRRYREGGRNKAAGSAGSRSRRRLGIRILMVLLIAVIAVTIAAFLGWRLFVLKNVEIVGNIIYSDEQLEDWILSEDYSWNTLYVMFETRQMEDEEVPFVGSMEVKMLSPTKLEFTVEEKGMLGYVYVPSLGMNAYFDQDGFVVDLSNDIDEEVTKVTGLDVESAELYEKLSLTDESVFKTILTLTQLLQKYDLRPEIIYLSDEGIILSYGSIQVNLGSDTQLNEKILRLQQILPELEGQTGTLHMDTWSESNNDIHFKAGELTEIPVDRQTVPAKQQPFTVVTEVPEEETEEEEAADEEESYYDDSSYGDDYYDSYYDDSYYDDSYYDDSYYDDSYYDDSYYDDTYYDDTYYGDSYYDDSYYDDSYYDDSYYDDSYYDEYY